LALDSGWTTPKVEDPVWHDDEIVDAEVVDEIAEDAWRAEEPVGWDVPPPGVAVTRNPNPDGPRWIRREIP
jgi:hypothetical protein